MVFKLGDDRGDGVIICDEHTAFTCTDGFSRVKGKASDITKGTGMFLAYPAVKTACGIFNDLEPMFLCKFHDIGHIRTESKEIDRHDRLDSGIVYNQSLKLCFINIERTQVNIAEHHFGTGILYGIGRSDVGKGGNNYFVSTANTHSFKPKMQCCGT